MDEKIKHGFIEELVFYEKRELEKLRTIFNDDFMLGQLRELDFWPLIESYFNDMLFFHKKGDLVKSFELSNYLWGYLDALANAGIIEVKKEFKNWFKIY